MSGETPCSRSPQASIIRPLSVSAQKKGEPRMARIDFSSALGDAFAFTANNLGRLFRLCGLWLALIIAFQLFALFMPGIMARGTMMAAVSRGLYVCFYLAVSVMFAVAWHRAVLRSDGPRTMMDMMHFGRREWRFLGYLILFAATVCLPLIGAVTTTGMFIVTRSQGIGIVMTVCWLLSLLVWLAISRLSLALPAAAVDESGGGLGIAWQRGKGNMMGLFFGPIACTVPFVFLSFVLYIVFAALATVSPAFDALRVVIIAALGFVQAGFGVSFLSFCYRQVASTGVATPRRMAAMPAE
jgi:hypothetical protein